MRNVWLLLSLACVPACRSEAPRDFKGAPVDPYEYAHAVKAGEPVTPAGVPSPVGTPPTDPTEKRLCEMLTDELGRRANAHLHAADGGGARPGEAEAHEKRLAEMQALANALTDESLAAKRALARRLIAACAPERIAELEKAEASSDRVRIPADRSDEWPW